MILPHSHTALLILMALSMLCCGSWASTFKLTKKWRFELYYFDFVIGAAALALIIVFTFGSLGYDGFTFTDDVLQAGKRQWVWAIAAGVIFNFGNMLLLAAISVAGMAISFPITLGVALILSSLLAHLSGAPSNMVMLLGGCGLIVGAAVCAVMVYRTLADVRHERAAKAGLAKSTRRPAPIKAAVLAAVGGVLMSLYEPLVAKATVSDIGLGPYGLLGFFIFGLAISAFVFNMFLMNLPVEGEPVDFVDYFRGKPKNHGAGILAGMMWAAGTAALLVANAANAAVGAGSSLRAGELHMRPAVAAAFQHATPLVAVLLGFLIFRELKGRDGRVTAWSVVMVLLYAAGVALICLGPAFATPAV